MKNESFKLLKKIFEHLKVKKNKLIFLLKKLNIKIIENMI